MPEAPYTIMEKDILQHTLSIVCLIYLQHKVYSLWQHVIKGTLHLFALSFVSLETQ